MHLPEDPAVVADLLLQVEDREAKIEAAAEECDIEELHLEQHHGAAYLQCSTEAQGVPIQELARVWPDSLDRRDIERSLRLRAARTVVLVNEGLVKVPEDHGKLG